MRWCKDIPCLWFALTTRRHAKKSSERKGGLGHGSEEGPGGMNTYRDLALENLRVADLFPDWHITDQILLLPHHPGQASYVWKVSTANGPAIIRTPRFTDPPDEDFWQGSLRLFDVRTTQGERLVAVNSWLSTRVPLSVPRVLATTRFQERSFVLENWLPGTTLHAFSVLTDGALETLGTMIGRLHREQSDVFGPAVAEPWHGFPIEAFSTRLEATMCYLFQRYDRHHPTARRYLSLALADLAHLHFDTAVPLLLDMEPSQFLTHQGEITALVDTELYVRGPAELELTGLELLLTSTTAQPFSRGYRRIQPLPILSPSRRLFRVLLRLLSFQGPVDWDDWMGKPTFFA